MIAVLQRVKKGSVRISEETVGSIAEGLVVFLGVFETDTSQDVQFLTDKICDFRIFNDDNQKMNLSIKDVSGQILVISQFTLCGDWLKGRRPSFISAACPEKGKALYLDFIQHLRNKCITVETGKFGAMMNVELINDGPVTFVLDSEKKQLKQK